MTEKIRSKGGQVATGRERSLAAGAIRILAAISPILVWGATNRAAAAEEKKQPTELQAKAEKTANKCDSCSEPVWNQQFAQAYKKLVDERVDARTGFKSGGEEKADAEGRAKALRALGIRSEDGKALSPEQIDRSLDRLEKAHEEMLKLAGIPAPAGSDPEERKKAAANAYAALGIPESNERNQPLSPEELEGRLRGAKWIRNDILGERGMASPMYPNLLSLGDRVSATPNFAASAQALKGELEQPTVANVRYVQQSMQRLLTDAISKWNASLPADHPNRIAAVIPARGEARVQFEKHVARLRILSDGAAEAAAQRKLAPEASVKAIAARIALAPRIEGAPEVKIGGRLSRSGEDVEKDQHLGNRLGAMFGLSAIEVDKHEGQQTRARLGYLARALGCGNWGDECRARAMELTRRSLYATHHQWNEDRIQEGDIRDVVPVPVKRAQPKKARVEQLYI